jgi:polyferredoxin
MAKTDANRKWMWMRRASQLLFVALFLLLFRMTDYHGRDEIGYAVNIFFRWDPLAAAAATLAARALIALFIPALVVLALTAVLGRFFCGWVCPLGTCLDAAHLAIPPRAPAPPSRRAYKYYVLIVVLVAALLGLPLAGWVDPFSILVRGLAVAVDPGLNAAVSWPFDYAYQHGPHWLTALTEPVYAAMKSTVLPYAQKGFLHASVSIIMLAAVIALERIERRFWCRNLCPLGALLALPARVAPLRMHPGRACRANGCTTCIDVCRMGAIDAEGNVSPEACNLCLECMTGCEKGIISFRFKRPKPAPAPIGLSRRGVASAIAAGAAMPLLLTPRGKAAKSLTVSGSGFHPEALIRPPGAQDEAAFVGRCVRCGECMKVCINNALHPALTEAGLAGVFTPMLVPRIGGCEFNCTLCGQVCPSGAIPRLAKPEKQKTVIGLAYFDRNRCRPWADLVGCSVCEEMCPLPEKAIVLREEPAVNRKGETVTIKRPYLVPELCIGCGLCENKCPLPGPSAVRVGVAEGEMTGTGP